MKGWREGSGVSRSLKSLEKSEIDSEVWCFLSPQLAFEVLGEHPEEPSLHLRRPRDGGGGRVAARHLSDLHGRLHQVGAQTQQSQYTQIKIVQSVFKSQEMDRTSPLCLQINTYVTATNRRATAHKTEMTLRESAAE